MLSGHTFRPNLKDLGRLGSQSEVDPHEGRKLKGTFSWQAA